MNHPEKNEDIPLPSFETYMGSNWEDRLDRQLFKMSQHCLRSVKDVRTAEDALRESLTIVETMEPTEKEIVETKIEDLCQNGNFVVVRGDFNSPDGHAFFHLIGARHCQVANIDLFAIPLSHFVKIRTEETAEDEGADTEEQKNENEVVALPNEKEDFMNFAHLVIRAEIDAVLKNKSIWFREKFSTTPRIIDEKERENRLHELEKLQQKFNEGLGLIENHGGQVSLGDAGSHAIFFNHPEHPHYKRIDGSFGQTILDLVEAEMPTNAFAQRLFKLIQLETK